MMKPMLASDWDPAKQRFPVLAQPKIDGVRALNLTGTLTGRSLKQFKNKHVTSTFSKSAFLGFDGEFASNSETHERLCSLTTSAVGTIAGQPWLMWHVFDLVTRLTVDMPYHARLGLLRRQVAELQATHPLGVHVRVVPTEIVGDMETLEQLDARWLEMGYEGTILRDPEAPHKSGRSTVKEGGLLRVKRFTDSELEVVSVNEGRHNANEAKINQLGQTERSTHAENMVPNGMVGSLECRALADVVMGDRVVVAAGDMVTVGAGRLTHEEREGYFRQQNLIVGRVIKAKFFPIGIKDKLRFPTFQSFRTEEDMS